MQWPMFAGCLFLSVTHMQLRSTFTHRRPLPDDIWVDLVVVHRAILRRKLVVCEFYVLG